MGVKLVLEYAHAMRWIAWEIPKTLSSGLVVVIFAAAYLYARLQGAEDRQGNPPPPESA